MIDRKRRKKTNKSKKRVTNPTKLKLFLKKSIKYLVVLKINSTFATQIEKDDSKLLIDIIDEMFDLFIHDDRCSFIAIREGRVSPPFNLYTLNQKKAHLFLFPIVCPNDNKLL